MSHTSLNQSNSNTGSSDKASEALMASQERVAVPLSPRKLHEATLFAMKLNGVESSRDMLIHGLPTEEHAVLEGMMRALQSFDSLSVSLLGISDMKGETLPCVVELGGEQGGELSSWAVIESFDSQRECFRVRCFDGNVEAEARELSLGELKKSVKSNLLMISRKVVSETGDGSSRSAGFSVWLWRELKSLRAVYRDIIVATLLINLFAVASPLFVMNVYDRVVPNLAMETLWVLASGLSLVIIFELTIKLLRHSFLEQAGKQLDLVLSSKLFSRVLNIRMDSFPESVGSLASQIKEFESIKQFFTAATITALADVPFALLFLLVIAFVGGEIVFVPLVIGLVMIVYGYLMHFPIKKLVDEMQVAAAEKNGILVESISGIETIKSLNAQGRQQGFWESALIRLSHFGDKAKHLTDSVGIVSSALMQLSTMLIIIVGVYLIEQQALSLGALIACVLLGSRALSPMVQIASLVAQYQQARTAYQAVDALTDLSAEQGDSSACLPLGGRIESVEVRDLSFSYSSGTKVLRDLSFSLKKGEKVAIIGKIGSGKSSLLRLLQGFARAEHGQLLINGYDVRHLDMSELRASIAYVPQEINLFKGSLRDNIVMKSPDAPQSEVMRVAEIAGLSDLIQGHEMGLDMPIGEHGKGLSGGQRQCVAIARAMINRPDMLLFDELTSSMDNQTEQLIINNIQEVAADKILLLSTHRASLLKLVDRIIVMDQGKIIADGPKVTVLDAMKRGLIQAGSKPASDDSTVSEKGKS